MISQRTLIAGAIVLTFLNLGILAANISIRANAAVAGMDWHDLWRDIDFRRAVESVVETCKMQGEKIKC